MTDERAFPSSPEIDITAEMESSFIDYAMSVIVSRALPDVRDGLKPVQRRIIFSMFENNISPTGPHRKCAKVVGDVMGNYHPHGDSAIYDALVRMGQDFSMRYLLIDPQGNFGSIDDPPGAARYTECRMAKLSTHLLDGINENTVDFEDNYNGELQEPTVLPSRFPNLLVNGSQGIAVGMATNIPPHNLGEVVDAALHTIDNPDATSEELLQFVKGPDFPTGGYLVGTTGAREALTSGRGSVKVRAACDVQEVRKGRTAIVVTELPYQVSIERVITKIKELVDSKKLGGVADARNESSDRAGTRLVIELRSDAVPQVVMNQLYKLTPLQDSVGYNMVALVDGVPRTLGIAEMIGYYLDHQMEVVERRTQFRLDQAEARAHVLEGLVIAVDNIDEVVRIIRASSDTAEARASILETFSLSEIQANAILDMPLRRLTALEVDKLRAELDELAKTIKELKGILADPKKRWQLIKDELVSIREQFGDDRRTKLVPDEGDLSLEDLIADDELIITVSEAGYIKSVPTSTYKTQTRGGRGVKAAEVPGGDIVRHLIHTTAHAYLLVFTNRGVVHRIKAHAIPRQSRTAKGVLVQSVLPIGPDEVVQSIIDTRDYETSRYLVMVTAKGQAKKTEFKEYDSRNQTLVAIKLADDDELVSVRTTNGQNDILIFTRAGNGIRFKESDLRPMGRGTQGVRGIKLREGDRVIAAVSNVEGVDVLLLTAGGYGKRTSMTEFRAQARGGIGVKAFKITRVRGNLVTGLAVKNEDEVFLISSSGVGIRTPVGKISRQKRDSTGVKVIGVGDGNELAAAAIVSDVEALVADE